MTSPHELPDDEFFTLFGLMSRMLLDPAVQAEHAERMKYTITEPDGTGGVFYHMPGPGGHGSGGVLHLPAEDLEPPDDEK